jgi:hypothetical protein
MLPEGSEHTSKAGARLCKNGLGLCCTGFHNLACPAVLT